MSRALVPLLDMDILVYRCGFACKEGEPLEYALQTVKSSIDGICGTFPDAPQHKMYLTGKGNYRESVAVTRPYKGNRDPANKPHYYDEIRQYMIDYHDSKVIEGMEADDALGIEQWANKDRSTVIVSIDKDLRCIPGWHYNYVKQVLDYVTLAEANKNFWSQVITGDTTDNIPGLPKYGPKAAEKIISSTDGSWIEMYTRVKQEYDKVFGSDADRMFKEQATLIWIQREHNVNFDGTPIVEEKEEMDDCPF